MTAKKAISARADSSQDAPGERQGATDPFCQEAVEHLGRLREVKLGDVVDGTLDLVKRYPGASMTVAALVGFFLGRWFRR
jgi:ElaB/YqjD/DUF883 family membrane-anchored ribosome-binding protein